MEQKNYFTGYMKNEPQKEPSNVFLAEKTVNIAFAVDLNYLQFLNVSLISLVEHITKDYVYNIYILHENINLTKQSEFLQNFNAIENLNIIFINVSHYLENINADLYIEIHVTRSTYYRFFVQEIFSQLDRILYLDTDLIIQDDIAKLYFSQLNEKPLGVVFDVREQLAAKLNLTVSNGIKWREYIENILSISDYCKYFQAGVIVFDIRTLFNQGINLRDLCITKLKKIKKPILSDQDVLNSCFFRRVHYLPLEWNVEWQIPFEFPAYKELMGSLSAIYIQAYEHPKVLHYASSVKPWNHPNLVKSEIWWSYARKSPYYNQLLLNLKKQSRIRDFFIKKFINKILPLGSKRRYFVVKLYHSIF